MVFVTIEARSRVGNGNFTFVVRVALARSVRWVARRSLRFLTGLALFVVALGTGTGQAMASPPPPSATVAAPAATVAAPAATPATLADATAADNDDTSPACSAATRAVVLAGQSDEPGPSGPATQSRKPRGGIYTAPGGPRAPPLG